MDEATVQLLGMVNSSIAKLLSIMVDMTEIAKVQKNTDGEKEPISFREMLSEVLEELAEKIRESEAIIHLRLDAEKLVYSRKHLRSVLTNLLSNALKYRSYDRTPEIDLTFELREGQPALVVADNGLGLNPNQLTKLFTLYKRFHDHVEGTGLGLYMIKRMVENNGGRIEVESQPGKGTTFTVHFGALTSANALD